MTNLTRYTAEELYTRREIIFDAAIYLAKKNTDRYNKETLIALVVTGLLVAVAWYALYKITGGF
jgi:hypothetical protein